MRVYRELLMTVLLLSSLLIIPSTSSARSKFSISSSERKGLNWLRTDGKWIVDSEGNITSWHGVNILDLRKRPSIGEDYGKMASWGVKIVRMPMEWHQIEPQPGTYDLSYLEYVDNQITWAKKYGIRVILDMHHWYWSPHFTFFSNTSGKGYGMPVWMVNGYPDSPEGLGQAITDFWLGKAPNGTEANETNLSMQDRFIELWKYIVDRYRNEALIMAYELLNEPLRSDIHYEGGLTVWQTASYLYPLYKRLISAIRSIDPKRIIIYEPVGGWHIPSAMFLSEPNLIFSFHSYELNKEYDGNATALEELFYNKFLTKPKSNPIRKWNMPLLLGEFGTQLEFQNSDLWIKDMLTILRKYQLHWIYWAWYKADKGYALLYSNGTEKTLLTEPLKQAID